MWWIRSAWPMTSLSAKAASHQGNGTQCIHPLLPVLQKVAPAEVDPHWNRIKGATHSCVAPLPM